MTITPSPLASLLAVASLLALTPGAAAFSPRTRLLNQKPAFSSKTVLAIASEPVIKSRVDLPEVTFKADEPPAPLRQVFSGIGLPAGEDEPPRIDNIFTKAQVGAYATEGQGVILASPAIIGQPKTPDSLKAAQDLAIRINKLNVGIEAAGIQDYKFFGNDDFATSLRLLLTTNPFMTPALTELSGGDFELKTFDPEGNAPTTLYGQILSTLGGVGHRVNIQFDSKMECITSWEMFDDVTGRKMKPAEVDLQTAASSAIYNLFFFASCIHATIHVLHYIYTAAFQVASKDFEEMNEWANDYAKNIATKYTQVGELLITEPLNQLAVLTGGSGLGSSQAVSFILKEVLKGWGRNPTAEGFYFDFMLNISKDKVGGEDGVFLEEFMKHYDLIAPFAQKASGALKDVDCTKYDAAEKELGCYLRRCGEFTSTLSTLDQWLEIMAVTGAMHGGTLSYSRAIAMPEVLRWRNFAIPAYDFPDAFLLFNAVGTIVGIEDGRHVMTDSEGPYTEKLQAALKEFNDETTKLKETYQDEVQKRDDFKDFGWILSDYCLDDFDGKQMTIATYV